MNTIGHRRSIFLIISVSLLKGFITFIMFQTCIMLGYFLIPKLGLTLPSIDINISMGKILLMSMPGVILMPIILGEFFKRLNQKAFERFICLFIFIYIIYGFLQVLEQIIFTTMITFGFGVVFNIFPAFALSLAVTILWQPSDTDESILREIPSFFSQRNAGDWAWRIILAILVYLPIYYTIGMIISPLVMKYYNDPSLNLGLTLPSVRTII